jgi:hypothetical protein
METILTIIALGFKPDLFAVVIGGCDVNVI